MKSFALSLIIGSVLLLGLPSPSVSAPTDLFILDASKYYNYQDLLYHGLGGIGLGLAGGALTAGVGAALGLGAKKDKINAIANIVNSKVGLLNLKTNVVRAGIEGAGLVNSLLGGEEEEEEEEKPSSSYSRYPRYPSYRRSYYQRPQYYGGYRG